jgi:hypothetical protein
MSATRIYTAIGVWLVLVAAAAVGGVASGVHMTMGMALLTLVVGVTPPLIFLRLLPKDEPQTVAQLLKGRP